MIERSWGRFDDSKINNNRNKPIMSNIALKHYVAGAVIASIGAVGLRAQTNTVPAADASVAIDAKCNSTGKSHPYGITAEVGTTGAGGAVSWRFLPHFGARAGMDYFNYSYSGKVESADYNAKFRLMSEPLTLDVYPWKTHSFRLSLGVLLNQNRFSGNAKPNSSGTIDINGNPYTSADLGSLDLKIDQPTACPYVGIGGNFFYFDHAHHWAMGGELGVAYGKWSVDLHHSGGSSPSTLDADIAAERAKIQDNVNRCPVWPVLKLNVSYSF
jgi:hypothetical protein